MLVPGEGVAEGGTRSPVNPCPLRLLVLLLCLPLAALPPGGARAAPPGETATGGKEAPEYLGSERCKGCHEALYKAFEATAHWKTMLDKRRDPATRGCEACHGPGKEHAERVGAVKVLDFRSLSPARVVATCLACHQYTEEHANFLRSMHRSSNMSCLDCHSPHHAAEGHYLLRSPQPQLCYRCHWETKPEFSKPFHHRVEEGLVKCTDCHNQHGGYLTKQLRSTPAQEEICGKCHAEKLEPFVFEHAPVKTEGCVACHAPHGASNPRLLTRSQVNLLCLECHTITAGSRVRGTSLLHDQNQKYQACTLCHTSIHGSNFDPLFFK